MPRRRRNLQQQGRLLLWLKPEIREVLVPVMTADTRSYEQKWNDEGYVKAVKSMDGNNVFVTEVFEALKNLRLAADSAVTPEELKGVQKGITALRKLLTAPRRAKDLLEGADAIAKLNEQE